MNHFKQTVFAISISLALGGCTQNSLPIDSIEQTEVSLVERGANRASQGAVKDSPTKLTLPLSVVATTPVKRDLKEELSLMDDASGADSSAAGHDLLLHVPKKLSAKQHSRQLTAFQGLKKIAPPEREYYPSSAGSTGEKYAETSDNPIQQVAQNPVSTLSIDVDSGSYALVRRNLHQGKMPETDMVRIEEMVNYFNYDYPQPDGDAPFAVITEMGQTPWNSHSNLIHVGIQGVDIDSSDRPAANFVFLLDVSGSMSADNKLPLLKSAFRLLSRQLTKHDKVAIVVYAGASGMVLESTSGDDKVAITAALEQLNAGGSTHGSAGIRLAYQLAEKAKIENGINRVILATDGDFNVGLTNHERLIALIEEKRKGGISLTTLGFGSGNYNDQLMEQLADKGNGNYAYIDTINEAQKVLVDELSSTLHTIAKDVKIQIEFNPAVVSSYRLIGYQNRLLEREDFNNDKVDAGEIGAGHTVTALYEINMVGRDSESVIPLRYQVEEITKSTVLDQEIAHLRLRYKEPNRDKSTLITQVISRDNIRKNLHESSDNYRFSAAVAGFAQKLRLNRHLQGFDYDALYKLASESKGQDSDGYRGEFLRLIRLAENIAQ